MDGFGSPASSIILEQVAKERSADVEDLEPLYGSIDPDALDRLVAHGFDGAITFSYEGCEVTVSGDGDVHVTNGNTVR